MTHAPPRGAAILIHHKQYSWHPNREGVAMKQSEKQKLLVWVAGSALIATSFVFAQLATSHTNDSFVGSTKGSADSYAYAGSSQDYAAAPHPWSLTYAGVGSIYHMQDTERRRRWEREARQDLERESLKWARIEGISVDSE
jgi:hypothetical protein